MIRTLIALSLMTGPAIADTVVAARTIPAQSTIMPEDIMINSRDVPGGISDPSQIIGMEARVA